MYIYLLQPLHKMENAQILVPCDRANLVHLNWHLLGHLRMGECCCAAGRIMRPPATLYLEVAGTQERMPEGWHVAVWTVSDFAWAQNI